MRLYSDPGNAPTTLIASSYPKIRRVNFTHLYQKLQIFSKYFTLTERNWPKKDPSLERNDLRSNFFVEREGERWSEIQLGKADYTDDAVVDTCGWTTADQSRVIIPFHPPSSGGLPPPLSREWRGLEWFQRGRQRNGRYSSILRRFPWKTMQTRGRIPSSTQHLNRTTLVEWENRVIRPWIA